MWPNSKTFHDQCNGYESCVFVCVYFYALCMLVFSVFVMSLGVFMCIFLHWIRAHVCACVYVCVCLN